MGIRELFGFGTKRTASPYKETGTGGTQILLGQPTPVSRSPKLQGEQRWRTFEETLRNVTIVSLGVNFLLKLGGSVSWRFDSADEGNADADEYAEFMAEEWEQMVTPPRRVIRKCMPFELYGHAIMEWTARKRDDGKIGIRDVESRPQHTIYRWDVDDSGTVQGVVQRSPQDFREIYLPRTKLAYFVDDALTDSPEGLGVLERITPAVQTLERYLQLEGIGYDADMRGLPIGYAPIGEMKARVAAGQDGYTEATMTSELAGMTNLLQHHIVHPKRALLLDSSPYMSSDDKNTPSGQKKWGIDILRGAITGQADLAKAIDRLTWEIAAMIGVEQTLLGKSNGTQALSADKSSNLRLTVESSLAAVTEVLQRDVIVPIAKLNGWDEKLIPKLMHDPIRAQDVEALVGVLEGIARASGPIDIDHPAIDVILTNAGLPKTPEVILERRETDAMIGGNNRPPPKPGTPPAGDEEDVDVSDLERDPSEQERRAKRYESSILKAEKTHTGVMVALFLPDDVAQALAVPGGEPAESMHVTLAYLGKETSRPQRRAAFDIIDELARTSAPIDATLGGLGRFSASSTSEGMDVAYVSVDSPGITTMRQTLVERLEASGVPVSMVHGFSPHITLAYIPMDASLPLHRIEPVSVTFGQIALAAGPDRQFVSFTGTEE